MKEKYTSPEMEVILFEHSDIIVTSGTSGENLGNYPDETDLDG